MVLLLVSCSERTNGQFSLIGKTSGLEDGTVIYIINADSQIEDLIDSSIVKNNSFEFNKKLSTSPLQVVIKTKDWEHYRYLWLESNPMTFDATQHDFENAIVTGSDTEDIVQPFRKQIENLSEDEQEKKELVFIQEHPSSIASAEMLSLNCIYYGKDKSEELFDQFSRENKLSKYGKIISNYINMYKGPDIGMKYIDFKMTDLNDNPMKLSELEGKTILLEFWASWCAPCRKENPRLVQTYNKYHQKGFEIFAVSTDEKKKPWIRAIKKDSLDWYHVNDFKGNGNIASLIYGIKTLPESYLIDKNGIIVAKNLHGDELDKKLEELLN